MRVEVTFGGDAAEATGASELVVDALKKLFVQADATGLELKEVKITSAQATESEANVRRIKDQLEALRLKADETNRSLNKVQVGGGLQGAAANLSSLKTIGLAGLIGTGVAASGPVGAGALAGLAALPGLVASGGAAVGVLVAAFHGLGKAIDGNEASFKKLNPDAQQLVQTIRSLEPWVKQLQQTAQKGLLPGVDDFLHGALSPANSKAIEQGVSGIATALSGVAKEWGQSLGSPEVATGLKALMGDAGVEISNLGDAADHFGSALGRLTVAAGPLTIWMTKAIDDGAKLADEWVANEQASGRLAGGLSSAKDQLEIVGRFVEALVSAAFDLARTLEPLGDTILVDLTKGLEGLGKWLEQNKTEIDDVTEGALKGFIEALKLAGDVLVPLGKDIYQVTGATTGFKTAFVLLIGAIAAFKVANVVSGLALIGDTAYSSAGKVAVLESTLISVAAKFLAVQQLVKLSPGQSDLGLDFSNSVTSDSVGAHGYVQGTGQNTEYALGLAGKPDPFATAGPGQTLGPGSPATHSAAYLAGLAAYQKLHVKTPTAADLLKNAGLAGGGSAFSTPPAFTSGTGGGSNSYGLPLALQTAIDKAATTAPKADDIRAYTAAVNWVKDQIKNGVSGQNLDTAYQLLAGYQSSLTGLQPKPATAASKASLLSAQRFTSTVLGADTSTPAVKSAQDTAKVKADLESLSKVQDELKPKIIAAQKEISAALGGDGTISATDLATLRQRLTDWETTIKNAQSKVKAALPALPTASAKTSASNLAKSLVTQLGTDPLAAAIAPPESVAAAEKTLDDLRAKLLPEIKSLSKEIASGTLTKTDLATVTAQLNQYKTTITAGVQAAAQAVADEKSLFQQAFQAVGQTAITELQNEMANYKSPADVVLQQLEDAHNDQQLQDALTQANKDLANALVPVPDNATIVQNIQTILGQATLAQNVDQIQSMILGGAAQGISSNTLINQLQQALGAENVPDPQAVEAAQKEVADAQYEITVEGLQKTAAAQTSAYDDTVNAQIDAIGRLDSNWNTYFDGLGGNISQITGEWIGLLQTMGVSQTTIASITAQAATAIQQATGVNTAPPVTNAHLAPGYELVYLNGQPFVTTPAVLASMGATELPGGGYTTQPQLQLHAAGGVATRAMYRGPNDVVGEAGNEAWLPLDNPRSMKMISDAINANQGDVHVHVHTRDEALADFIDVRVDRSVPRISRQLGVRASGRQRSGQI